MKKLIGFLIMCMFLPVGAFAEQDTIPLEKITDPDMAHEMFVKAINEKNIDQLCAMYTDDAVMVLRDGKLEVSGQSSIRRVFSIMVDMVETLHIETVYRLNLKTRYFLDRNTAQCTKLLMERLKRLSAAV